MSYKKVIVSVLIIGLLAVAFYSIRGVLTPYVTFEEAMQLERYVQVIGKVRKADLIYDEGSFTFSLIDKDGTTMRILYRGVRPLNFEHAKQVVVLGKYNRSDRIFEADKILVKCPSKYTKEEVR